MVKPAKSRDRAGNWDRVKDQPEKANPSLTQPALKSFGDFLPPGGAQIPLVPAGCCCDPTDSGQTFSDPGSLQLLQNQAKFVAGSA